MPRFTSNRWWTFILTLGVLTVACYARPASICADVLHSELSPDAGIIDAGGGVPTPVGVGDPDVPVATQLKKTRGGSLNGGDAYLTMRAVGDGRYVGVSNVWMWRLSVMAQALRVYLIR